MNPEFPLEEMKYLIGDIRRDVSDEAVRVLQQMPPNNDTNRKERSQQYSYFGRLTALERHLDELLVKLSDAVP